MALPKASAITGELPPNWVDEERAPLTQEQQHALEEFAESRPDATRAEALRCLKARSFDIEGAHLLLDKFLEFRLESKPDASQVAAAFGSLPQPSQARARARARV